MAYRAGSWSLSEVRTSTLNSSWGPDSIAGEPGCMFVWGANECGQLGDGTVIPRSSPQQIPGTNWIYVTAGDKHAAGIKADGTLWTWGEGCAGQLGDNNSIPRSSPVQVPGSWICLGAGGQHTAAIKNDNTLWVWGFNQYGQLGDNCILGSFPRSSPVQVPGTDWLTVTAASNSTYATNTTGCMFVWGHNNYGQLGLDDVIDRSSPTQIPGTNWISSMAYDNHTIGLKTDGTLWGWGHNPDGRIGLNNTISDILCPVQLPGTGWVEIGGGIYAAIARKNNNTLWSWGVSPHGNTGLGDNATRSCPVQIGAGSDWIRVSCGPRAHHHAAIKSDGSLWTWGYNPHGELGCGATGPNSSPVQVGAATSTYWRDVATGHHSTLAVACVPSNYTL